jgi:hypothetical protein
MAENKALGAYMLYHFPKAGFMATCTIAPMKPFSSVAFKPLMEKPIFKRDSAQTPRLVAG